MVKAIRYVLKQHDYKAGEYTVQYQSCDDSTRRPASGMPRRAPPMPTSTPADQSVIGVIGTFNSGCAELKVPVMNRVSTWDGEPGQHVASV